MAGILDETLPWDDFMVSHTGGCTLKPREVDGDLHNVADAADVDMSPSVALRTTRELGHRYQATSQHDRVVNHPAWVYLTERSSAAVAYELERSSNTLLTCYRHPEAEDEFWRFVFWRFHWEPPVMLLALGLSFALRIVSPLPVDLFVVYAAAAGSLVLASVALAVTVWRAPSESEIRARRLRAALWLQVLPIFGIVLAVASSITAHAIGYTQCAIQGRFASDQTVCMRVIPGDYIAFVFVCALIVRRTLWAGSVMLVCHCAATLVFSYSAGFYPTDVALFGLLGFVLVVIFLATSRLMLSQQQRQFESAAQAMLGFRDLKAQAAALAQVAHATLPERVGDRLRNEALPSADIVSLRQRQTDCSTNVFVVAVEIKTYDGRQKSDLVAMIRSAHHICATLDLLSRQARLDHAGVLGDTHVIVTGLHSPYREDVCVVQYLVEVARLCFADGPLGQKHGPALSVAFVLGAARGEFVGSIGVRYCVTGPAVTAAVQLSRSVPIRHGGGPSGAHAALARQCAAVAEAKTLLLDTDGLHDDVVLCFSLRQLVLPVTALDVPSAADGKRLSVVSNRDEFDRKVTFVPQFSAAAPDARVVRRLTVNRPASSATDDPVASPDSQDSEGNPSVARTPEMTWYGRFVDDEQEAEYGEFARDELLRVGPHAFRIMGASFVILALFVGAEQGVDRDLRARTDTVSAAVAITLWLIFGAMTLGLASMVQLIAQKGVLVMAAVLFVVNLGGWIPLCIMTENIVVNRPYFVSFLLIPLNALCLQRLPWVVTSIFLLITISVPNRAVVAATLIISPGQTATSVGTAIAFTMWNARLASLQARFRFADTAATRRTHASMQSLAEVLRCAILSTFPRHCIRRALKHLIGATRDKEHGGVEERYVSDLVVAHIAFPATDGDGRIAQVVGQAIDALPDEVALVQAMGNELCIAGGFAANDNGALAVLDFLVTLHTIATAAELPFVAGVASEESESALIGTRDSLRFHVVGLSPTIARNLVTSVAPVPTQPSTSVAFLTRTFLRCLERQLKDRVSVPGNPLESSDSAAPPPLASSPYDAEKYLQSLGLPLHFAKHRDRVLGQTSIAHVTFGAAA